MFYTVYQITNRINGKIYIGIHKTSNLDDGYMGSGKYLKNAQAKYGIENFEKTILHIYDNPEEMKAKEIELVNEEFLARDDVYNLAKGGGDGFEYCNRMGLNNANKDKDEIYSRISEKLKGRPNPEAGIRMKEHHKNGKIRYDTFTGKTHSEEAKEKIGRANSKHQQSVGNSQYGSMWITNGSDNKKIMEGIDIIPEGWYKGRSYPPILSTQLEMCRDCYNRMEDIKWWNVYKNSGLSVSKFVRDIYPYNRASFYNMKARIENVPM